MKPTFAPSTLGLILCYALLGITPTVQAHECTPSDVAGKYAYTSTGTVVNPAIGAFMAVGHATLTETGTISGSQTTSVAGNLFDETLVATYTVNPDCTGSMLVHIYHGSTLARTTSVNLVWDSHEQEVRGIFLTSGTVITLLARKMFGDD
jgi:hypothetical protein